MAAPCSLLCSVMTSAKLGVNNKLEVRIGGHKGCADGVAAAR